MHIIDWVVLHPEIHAGGNVRCPCKGHGVGCLWPLLQKPNTGGSTELPGCHIM